MSSAPGKLDSAARAGEREAALRSTRLAGGAVVAVLFMGSALLTPLYRLYRLDYGLTALGLTLVYAVYVIGNLVALLFLGRLSDQLGRRPIVLAGLALAALSTILFLIASGSSLLFAGRIASGCAVGLGSGAATAWITEATPTEHRVRAASTMTAFNFVGLALGPVVAGLLVQYAPWPLRLPFLVYLGLIAIVAALVLAARETLDHMRAGPIELTPRLAVPRGKRLAFAVPAAAGFAAMALVGYYAALGPTMLHETLRLTNQALSGLIVAELFLVAAIAILITRRIEARHMLIWGLAAMPISLAALVAAQAWSSLALMLLGTTLSGIASALSYRGGLGAINALAPADRRAEMASAYFICCFLGNALPIVGVGALSEAMGAAAADRIFALGLSLIALAALAAAWRFGLATRVESAPKRPKAADQNLKVVPR
jgi:MFS family permease